MKNTARTMLYGALVTCLFFSCKQEEKSTIPWQPLFNGENLEGFVKKGGNAEYSVMDNSIVGTTKHNTPNTFLTTTKLYGDFILELEVKLDSSMNSGIQIRSNSIPQYMDGRVHGYQIEIDPSNRAWSGGVYDEARRGWLHNVADNPKAQEAFDRKGWNHYRIEAIGDTLKTWVNNVPVANLLDDKTAEGFIALQVHSIDKAQKAGTQVQWRNLNILTDNLAEYSKPSPLPLKQTKNQLTDGEKQAGWQLLWDGKTTNGWKGAKLDSFPDKGWEITDGTLKVLETGGGESTAGGDIITTDTYANFEFKVDFKITEGANSGIKYYVDPELNKGEGSAIGLEFQILDDARHPDAKLGNHEGSRTMGSLYDLIKADENKLVYPIGEWNTAHIVARDNKVAHYLNHQKIVEYERGSEAYKQLVNESKYAKWPSFGMVEAGPILLQDHGHEVYFKNIKILPISTK